jgi:tetratricopeptide (TPR) repeat protein
MAVLPLMGLAAQDAPSADALFAQGQFGEATGAYEAAVAKAPNDGAALAGLARMRLYEGQETKAIELARKALELAPGNPVATAVLATAQARQKTFGPDLYQIEPAASAATLTFVTTDPLPVVHATIGGREVTLMIDTGAPDIMIKRPLAEALGLTIVEAGEGMFAGGRRARIERTTVPDVQLGAIHIRNVPAGVQPGEGGLRLPGVEIDGIIGSGLLMHFLSTIDYCHGALVLAPRNVSAAFEARAKAGGANIVPFWLVADHFAFARARLNQADGLFHVDTGLAGGGLIATKETLDAAGIVPDEASARTGMGGGGPVRFIPFRASATLGSMTRADVAGSYTPDGSPYGMFPFKVAGAVSHGFFRQSRLTFDFAAMRLITEGC